MTGAGHEIELVNEGSITQAHNHVNLLRIDSDLTGAAGAGQPNLRIVIAANDSRIEVTEAIYLRTTKQGHVDQTTLEIQTEQICHRDDRCCACHECGITD